MKISIVIPAFNEERLLGRSLEEIKKACSAFTERNWTSEVIVCDNNSSDRTAEIARQAGAIVVFEPVNQIARARNRGASVATGDWVVFIDADSHPTSGLFRDMADVVVSDRYLGGGALIQMDTSSPVGRFFTGLWNLISRVGTLMAGSYIFVERSAFQSINGFSEKLFAGEELDLAKRLKSLARQRRKKLVILRAHPLQTSGRKLDLYSRKELIWFFARALVAQNRVLRNRETCHPWYDGRR